MCDEFYALRLADNHMHVVTSYVYCIILYDACTRSWCSGDMLYSWLWFD